MAPASTLAAHRGVQQEFLYGLHTFLPDPAAPVKLPRNDCINSLSGLVHENKIETADLRSYASEQGTQLRRNLGDD